MRRPSHYLLTAIIALTLPLLFSTASCSRQGEGERCDIANGTEGEDSDCDDGLVCTSSQLLGTSSDICCPAENATDPACTGALGTTSSTSSAGGSGAAGGSDATGGTSASGGNGGTSASGGNGGTSASGGNGGTSAAGGNGGTSTAGGSGGTSAAGGSGGTGG